VNPNHTFELMAESRTTKEGVRNRKNTNSLKNFGREGSKPNPQQKRGSNSATEGPQKGSGIGVSKKKVLMQALSAHNVEEKKR